MRFLFSLLMTVFCFASSAQVENQKASCLKVSFGLNLGFSFFHEKLPENVTYKPVLILGYYNRPLSKGQKNYAFSWYLEPQINPVIIGNKLSELEFGVNTGIAFSYQLAPNYQVYAAIGTGPHFVTVKTASQARGFIFSDNFIIGMKRSFLMNDKSYDLNLQYRFRHISNANLMLPNKGIDNHFVILGLNRCIN